MNSTCDDCHRESPSMVCVCSFPLRKVCAFCQSKHFSTAIIQGGLHFGLPLTAIGVVTSQEEWLRLMSDIPQTQRAQTILYASLKCLEEMESSIIAAYQDQEFILQKLRDEYLWAVRTMHFNAQQQFDLVVKESQDHLLDSNFASLHTAGQWLNYFKQAPKAHALFSGGVEKGSEEAYRKVYRFELHTELDFLKASEYWSWYARANTEVQTDDVDCELARALQAKYDLEATVQKHIKTVNSLKKENTAAENAVRAKDRSITKLQDQVDALKHDLMKAKRDHSSQIPLLASSFNASVRVKSERLELRPITPKPSRTPAKPKLVPRLSDLSLEEENEQSFPVWAAQTEKATSRKMDFTPRKEEFKRQDKSRDDSPRS